MATAILPLHSRSDEVDCPAALTGCTSNDVALCSDFVLVNKDYRGIWINTTSNRNLVISAALTLEQGFVQSEDIKILGLPYVNSAHFSCLSLTIESSSTLVEVFTKASALSVVPRFVCSIDLSGSPQMQNVEIDLPSGLYRPFLAVTDYSITIFLHSFSNVRVTPGRCNSGGYCTSGKRLASMIPLDKNRGAVLEAPKTSVADLSCLFDQQDYCGYSYTTNNYNIKFLKQLWFESPGGFPEAYLTVAAENSQRIIKGEWLRLFSPMTAASEPACLRFVFFSRYVDIYTKQYTEAEETLVHVFTHNGALDDWHWAEVTLLPINKGRYGLLFELFFSSEMNPDRNVGFKNISAVNGPCLTEVAAVPRPGAVNCTFEDPGYCGYRDEKGGLVDWFRGSEPAIDTASGIAFYMRTLLDTKAKRRKQTRTLLSPWFRFTDPACIRFQFAMQGSGWEVASLTLSARGRSRPGLVVWGVRTLADNTWHRAIVNAGLVIPVNEEIRFIWKMTGANHRAAISRIEVTQGFCQPLSCDEPRESLCKDETMSTCIPTEYFADGFSNCFNGYDELGYRPVFDIARRDEIAPVVPLKENKQVPINSLLDLYRTLGHQGEDLIYKCSWEGKTCSHLNFTQQVTDFGLCYTFNGDPTSILSTANTGSRSGLSLVFNVEQYEYMRGPNSDAGVKLYLHPANEVPEVYDLGFTISPGMHALAGIQLNEATNLAPPWGDCAQKQLKYHKEYTRSGCTSECYTERLLRICSCRDVYMPGNSVDDPRVCSVEEYFNCILRKQRASMDEDQNCFRECTKPCNQSVYEPSLSYASLSTLNVERIFQDKKEQLQKKYDLALETKYRVEPSLFVHDMMEWQNLQQRYIVFKSLIFDHLTSSLESSPFVEVVADVMNLIGMVLEDNGILMGKVANYQDYYRNIFRRTHAVFSKFKRKFQMKADELIERIHLLISQQKNIDLSLINESARLVEIVDFLQDHAAYAQSFFQNITREGIGLHSADRLLPKSFLLDESYCHNIEFYIFVVDDLKIVLSKINEQVSFDSLPEIARQLQLNVTNFETQLNTFEECIHEYSSIIDRVLQANITISTTITGLKEVQSAREMLQNYDKEMAFIINHSKVVSRTRQEYSRGANTKGHVYENLLTENGQILMTLNSLKGRIQTNVISYLLLETQGTCQKSIKIYMEILRTTEPFYRLVTEEQLTLSVLLIKSFHRCKL